MITKHRLINTILIALIVAIYALMAHLDGLNANDQEAAKAQDLQTAIKNEATEARFARAATEICGGENAGWQLVYDTRTIQCTATNRGGKTRKAEL